MCSFHKLFYNKFKKLYLEFSNYVYVFHSLHGLDL